MFPQGYREVRDEEIFAHIPPRLQAVLSKTQKELADEKKYRSILYPIGVEELEKVDVKQFYVVVGNAENHVCTKWSLYYDVDDYLQTLAVEFSVRIRNGQIEEEFTEGTDTGLGGYDKSDLDTFF